MSGKRVSAGSVVAVLAALVCLGPPLAVALRGSGVPMPWAVLVPPLIAAGFLWWHPRLEIGHAWRSPALAIAWVAVLAAGGLQSWRASVYADDPTRTEYSIEPRNPWRVEHCCFTAYAEGARFASAGGAHVYERTRYVPAPDQSRKIGPLKVDPYHYPPTFLLLPAAVRLVAPEFFDTRRVWFGLQALVLGGAFLAVGWWSGGDRGRRVAFLAALAWAAPTTFGSLQMGNFQVTAVPLALLGLVLAWSKREAAGGALLSFTAAGKVFPSMLVLHAAAALRWRATAWIAGTGLAFALAAWMTFGPQPFIDFVRDEFPRLLSGASFPQTEVPGVMPVNMSVYGLTAKLRQLGLAWLDQPAGKHVSQVYALALAAFVVWSGLRLRAVERAGLQQDRLRLAILWLAILNLSSLGGPFVPVMYGSVGTLWLLTLLAASEEAPSARWRWVGVFALVNAAVFVIPTPRPAETPAAALLVFSIVTQCTLFAVNVWAVASWVRASRLVAVRGPVPVGAV